jgi:hypothetical protein
MALNHDKMIMNTKIKVKGKPSQTIKYQGNFLRQFDFNLGCLASSPVVAAQIVLASIMTTTEALTIGTWKFDQHGPAHDSSSANGWPSHSALNPHSHVS